jgi:hypothetical protein
MDRNKVIRRSLTAAGRIALCTASLLFASALPASAAELDQHNDLVNLYVTTMHAAPIVADCAAHGSFIASTSNTIDHVEFSPESFDSTHATVTPWNDSFDDRKQRVRVDTIVSVDGIGIPQNSNDAPYDLKFRCGYVGDQMLAFSWNDPDPPIRAHRESAPHSVRAIAPARGKHAIGGKGNGKTRSKATGKHTRKVAPRKSMHKPSASAASKTRSHHTTKPAVKKVVKRAVPAKKKTAK